MIFWNFFYYIPFKFALETQSLQNKASERRRNSKTWLRKKRVEMGNDNEKFNQQVFRIISEKEKNELI